MCGLYGFLFKTQALERDPRADGPEGWLIPQRTLNPEVARCDLASRRNPVNLNCCVYIDGDDDDNNNNNNNNNTLIPGIFVISQFNYLG